MLLPRPAVNACVFALALNLSRCQYSSAQPVVQTERTSTNTSTPLDISLKWPIDMAKERLEGVHDKPLLVAGDGSRPPRYLALIAERHSGSTWMLGVLRRYFKGRGIVVTPTLCTWKAHMGLSADILTFLTKRWMVEPEEERLARRQVATKMSAGEQAKCIDNFLPTEVIPCDPNDRMAIYELDPDGEAYGNIYELRKAKIVDFNAVREWAPMYERIRYEDMLKARGLRKWLMSLETKYGLVGNHGAIPGGLQAKRMQQKISEMYFNSKSCARFCRLDSPKDKQALDMLNSIWDDELESSIGYERIQKNSSYPWQ